ncbi:MAG: protein tyrosine phosphatase [Nanoarchaeota archaeon]|nr:protein tyrosine phosphatase [Nanoarchaeota archaeon]
MNKPKLLFVCNAGRQRSVTGRDLYEDKGYQTKSCGIRGDKHRCVTKEKLEWCDIIIVMEEEQRKFIAAEFPKEYLVKKIITLDIHDIYKRNQEELIELLNKRVKIKCV